MTINNLIARTAFNLVSAKVDEEKKINIYIHVTKYYANKNIQKP